MKRLIALSLLSLPLSAGVLKVASFPVVHPLKTTKAVFKVATYPVRHPVKAAF